MSNIVVWGEGCKMCGGTGEGWAHGTLGGDGWTGKPCPHCVPGGDLYPVEPDDDGDDEPAPPCTKCGKIIEGWAHRDGEGNWYCDECAPVSRDVGDDFLF